MQIVLDDLRRVTHFARMKERQFAAHINQKNSAELRQEMNRVLRELDAMKKRSAELSKLFKRLYEDNVLGRVTDEQYRMLSGDYTDEQRNEALHISPIQYLNRYRIEVASSLLLRSHGRIEEVAHEVGFSDSNYFSRVFKKVIGFSPREYRQQEVRRKVEDHTIQMQVSPGGIIG